MGESWLAVSHDCINGAQQKGLVYWRNVVQEYHERKLHEPYSMHISRTEESLWKRWSYIKQETSKFCSVMEHVVANQVSSVSVMALVRNGHPQSIDTGVNAILFTLLMYISGTKGLGQVQSDAS